MAAWHRSTPSVFISYRRQDAEAFAGRLYDTLVQEFGNDRVFMDVDTLKPGDDYIKAIENKLRHIDVFLAVIGDQWVTVEDERGSARLQDEKDLLRLEVATALKRGIRVIPVLVGDAAMPQASELPADIANLSRLHAFELTNARFRTDAQLLVNALRGDEGGPGEGEKRAREWSWIIPLAMIQPVVFWLCGGMLYLQAQTRENLYPAVPWIFFGGLSIGVALAVLSWRAHNSRGVVQGSAQLLLGAAAALSLPAIGELLAKNVAFGLSVIATLFSAAAWWTIRGVPLASRDRRGRVDRVSEGEGGQEEVAERLARESAAAQRRRKRVRSYILVSIDLVGLLAFVAGAAVLLSVDRRDADPGVLLVVFGSLAMVLAMLGLILFGWIEEVRLGWMLGLATAAPLVFLVIAGIINTSTPIALALVAGLAVAAFGVEVLRRLRREFGP